MALGTKRKAANTLSKQPLDLPPATVHAFAGTASPEGWAMCDGSEVSRTDNAALFAAIGTTYGVGDGSTTFNLPDMRGEFLRGLDNMGTAQGARGKDVDGTARTIGQTQTDVIRNITGQIGTRQDDHAPLTVGSGAFTISDSGTLANIGTGSGTGYKDANFNASNVVPTGSENRPVNMAINYIIKL
jgi:microcystin-dependent protein